MIVLTVLVVAAIAVWGVSRPEQVAVVTGAVQRGRVERVVTNTRAGTVHACRRAKLAPALGGQIVALPVREGDRVAEGQLLVELWSQEGIAQERVAAGQARSAGLRAQEACGNAAIAEREAERARKLHRDDLLSEDQLDRALTAANALRKACEAARAETERSNAGVQVARANLTRTRLRAPFGGIVAKVNGEVGEFATPSPPGVPVPPVIDLIDDACLYVTAPIDEVDIAQIRVGQPAVITLEALPGRRFPARVRRVAPYVLDVEKQARTVDVEVELTNPEDGKALIVGYSADVQIVLDARDAVLRIPTPALREGNHVLVPDSRGVLEERRVETGIANWEFTEIRSGVAEREKVVVSVDRAGVAPGARIVEVTADQP